MTAVDSFESQSEALSNSLTFLFSGLGFLIYRSAKFAIFIINPLPGEEDIKWKTKPKLPNLSSIKSRRLKKKNLFDFLKGDRVDIEHSVNEVYPMNSIEEDMDDLDQESIPDIEVSP